MKTGIILAGGKSTRMGEDKALVNSNVKRLSAELKKAGCNRIVICLLYTSPSPRDATLSRMPSSA